MVEWRVQGREFANCNCAYGCPCQFNALPTYGSCEAVNGFHTRSPVSSTRSLSLPHGFEYRIAEVASGTTKATGRIPLDLKQSHAHFAKINLSQKGVLEEAA